MDITSWDLDTIPEEKELKEGRHVMEYYDSEYVTGKNGWGAIRILFKTKETGTIVSCKFSMEHDTNTQTIEIGKKSLKALANAAGVTAMKDTEELKGKLISALVKFNSNGYPEVNDEMGKTWQSAEETKSSPKPKVEEEEESSGIVDDEIPF